MIVLNRDDIDLNDIINNLVNLNQNIDLVNIKTSHLSSTYIRQLIEEHKAIDDYIDKNVIKYINDNNLYNT
jgi:nicotinic acid mononucleotide adenylyltransferase